MANPVFNMLPGLSRPLGTEGAAFTVAGAAAVFSGAVLLTGYPKGLGGPVAAAVLIAFFAAFLALYGREFESRSVMNIGAIALVLILALCVRLSMFDYRSGDYNDFLGKWMAHFRASGGFLGLKDAIGDYNMPYLYFLAAFSYLPVSDLYLIKLLSIAFELIMTLFAMKTLKLFGAKDWLLAASVLIIMLLPTFWLNSAPWGQCDAIYSSLILISFYFALKYRGMRSVIFAALAFSFKLQTVFFLPLFLIFLIVRRVRWTDLFAFPVTYLITILPALALGRPFGSVVGIYSNQVTQYSQYLTLNAPTIMTFVPKDAPHGAIAACGIAAAFIFIAALTVFAARRRSLFGQRELLCCAALMLCAVPFLLPSMHDRYFYPAELFVVLFSLVFTNRVYAFLLCSFSSYTAYHTYLTGAFLIDMRLSALIMLSCITVVALTLLLPEGGIWRRVMSTWRAVLRKPKLPFTVL